MLSNALHTALCGDLYTACVDTIRMVFWDRSHGCWGVCGCQGACMVGRGHAWLLGGVCGCQGSVHGCWGVHGCGGVCVFGGCLWFGGGGMPGCGGHAWLPGGHAWLWGACIGYDKIRYESYWNAFLLIYAHTKTGGLEPRIECAAQCVRG